jgi:hypothetical protein
MADPKLKVYGLLWLTRRAYLTIQGIGFFVVIGAIVYIGGRPRPEPPPGEKFPPLVATLVTFLDYLPLIAIGVLLLAGVETWIVLRKFRKLEQNQQSLAELTEPPIASSPDSPPNK